MDERWFSKKKEKTNLNKFALDLYMKNFRSKHE